MAGVARREARCRTTPASSMSIDAGRRPRCRWIATTRRWSWCRVAQRGLNPIAFIDEGLAWAGAASACRAAPRKLSWRGATRRRRLRRGSVEVVFEVRHRHSQLRPAFSLRAVRALRWFERIVRLAGRRSRSAQSRGDFCGRLRPVHGARGLPRQRAHQVVSGSAHWLGCPAHPPHRTYRSTMPRRYSFAQARFRRRGVQVGRARRRPS